MVLRVPASEAKGRNNEVMAELRIFAKAKGKALEPCGRVDPEAGAKRPSASGPWKARRRIRAKDEPLFRPEKKKNENAGG